MRQPIIAGNWKMHKTPHEAIELVNDLKRQLSEGFDGEVVVCPPFVALSDVNDLLLESPIQLGAQNCFWEDQGAFTGEVSPVMLKSVGVRYVIIGHSERRQIFGETNEMVNRKIQAVLKQGLRAIVCVGEVLEEREKGETFDVVKAQCEGSLAGLSSEAFADVVIAYEPVWAIGTGRTATPDQAQEVHAFIREWLEKQFNAETAAGVRIQYGGSVKPENAAELMAQPDIDGALVGGASLKADAFSEIVRRGSTVQSS